MVGWHHWLNGHEFEQPGDGEGQGHMAHCSPWGHKESDTTERPNNSNKRDIRKQALSMRYERTYTKGKGTFSALSHREFCWKQVQRIRQWSQCFLKLNWITRAERQKDLSKRQVNAWLPKPWAGKAWGQQRLGPTSRLPEHLFAHFMCSGMARTERIFVMSMPSNLWLRNSCHFDDVAFSLQLDSI